MPDPQDVQPEPSPAPEPEPTPEPAPSEPDERPLRNFVAELVRKQTAQGAVLDELRTMIQGLRPPTPAPSGQYTDEQLMELARAGSVEAQVELQRRIARQEAATQAAQQDRVTKAQQAFSYLQTKYPQFREPTDPLYQSALELRAGLFRQGYPAGMETDVEAMKLAVVEHPELIQRTPSPSPTPRTPAPAQIDGATPRRSAPARTPAAQLDPKVAAVARRMGVKDPAKALQKYQDRVKEGRSALSPLLTVAVREES